jgi:hypothetical protein
VGYWPFNGNANDESGNGNHGTVNGATLTSDRNGSANSAYGFDGVDDFIFTNLTGIFNQGITTTAWIKTNMIFTNYEHKGVVWSRSGMGMSTGIMVQDTVQSGGLLMGGGINEEGQISFGVAKNILPNDNQWHLLLGTASINQGVHVYKIYLDGVLLNSATYFDNQGISVTAPFLFGKDNIDGYGNRNWDGLLDDIAIYNRALTQEEITALYNGTTNTPNAGCTNTAACNYNASATTDDGSCTYPAQTYLNCAGTCINDADNDGTCDELEPPTLPSYLPSNGLVGYWPFNGNANDESGNGNHGTVNGATLAADRNGNTSSAYSFDGVDDFIQCLQSGPIGNSNVTASFWLKTDQVSYGHIIGYGSDAGSGTNFRIYSGDGGCSQSIVFDTYDNAVAQNNTHDNIWNFFTVVYESSNSGNLSDVKIYKNSSLLNSICFSVNNSLTNITNQYPIKFGKYHGTVQNGAFDGIIDDIAIYNRALTQEEITALYNGTTNNGGGGNGGTAGTPAQSVPQGIPYQAMIRDNNGVALMNTPVTVRFSLRQDAIDGTVEYQETHNLNTNTFGLVNTHFGTGTATQGTFAGINWSNTTKFIQVEANTGAGYVEMGTQQMMSVPFAIKANESNESAKIKNAGLPVFANNAAAMAGGLVAGDMYRTATGDLKIVY